MLRPRYAQGRGFASRTQRITGRRPVRTITQRGTASNVNPICYPEIGVIMNVQFGNGTTEYGPGVDIELSGNEVATAIMAYLVARGIELCGPRTITVNGELCKSAKVYVDPSGCVLKEGRKYSGRCVSA